MLYESFRAKRRESRLRIQSWPPLQSESPTLNVRVGCTGTLNPEYWWSSTYSKWEVS
jgi:hypothetical protein